MKQILGVVALALGLAAAARADPPRPGEPVGFGFAFLIEGGGEMARGALADETNPGPFARLVFHMAPARSFSYLRGELSLGAARLGRTVDAPASGLARLPVLAGLVLIAPIINGGGPYVRGGGGMSFATLERGGKTRFSEGSIDPALQYAAGFEVPITHRLLARLDISRTHQLETITGDFWAAGLGVGWRSEPDIEPLPAPVAPLYSPPPEPEPVPPAVITPADSDGDGVVDIDDKCAKEPGPAGNAGCPWPDKDNDGIPNQDDKCPAKPGMTPHGCPDTDEDGLADHLDQCALVPGPAPTGCPEADRDGDGVLDNIDRCPDVPGAAPTGCPKKVLVVKHEDRIEIKQQINFETGRAKIVGRSSFEVLDQVAAVLKSNPTIKVVIEGHTDDRGAADYNLKLSGERANAVRDALIERDIDTDRLQAIGYGPSKPIASNRKASGRALNRRSEFTIVQSGEPAPTPMEPTPFYLKVAKAQTLRDIAKTLWKSDTHAQLLADHNPEVGGPDGRVNEGGVVKFPRTLEYTVQPGDTLGNIAKQQLGNVKHYKLIAAASKSVMPDPNTMEAGMTLTIPLVLPEMNRLEKK